MNAKIPLVAGLLALLLFGSKKSPKKSSTPAQTIPPEQDIPKEDKPSNGNSKPPTPKDDTWPAAYPNITASRKTIVDNYIKNLPLQTDEPSPHGHYIKWASAKQIKNEIPYYQTWLANQVYWNISYIEGKSDIVPGQTGTLPWLLKCGEVAKLVNGLIETSTIVETDAECKKRIGAGQALWSDLDKYIKKYLTQCPVTAYCGEGFDAKGKSKNLIGLTVAEQNAVDMALKLKPYWDVATYIVPAPQNKYSPNIKNADWLTNVAYWVTYRDPNQEWVKYGNSPAPVVPVNLWVPVWLRINNAIASKLK